VFYSMDQGNSWHSPQTLLDLKDIRITGFFSGSQRTYAYGDGIYLWTGATWSPVNAGQVTSITEGIFSRLFSTTQTDDPIAGTSELRTSDNGGSAWVAALSLTNSIDTESYFLPNCLAAEPDGHILCVRRDINFQNFAQSHSIYLSDDNGTSWVNKVIAFAPNVLYFKNGIWYAGTQGDGLFHSSDHGASWASFPGLASGVDITSILGVGNSILISITGNSKMLDGLYASDDNGASWKYLNNGNPNISGILTADDTYLYGGGPSVWRRPLQGLSASERTLQAESNLHLYPNPASDEISIHLTTQNEAQLILTIYDEKGMPVLTRTIETDPNSSEQKISLIGLSEGRYYARLINLNGKITGWSNFIVERR
ncbi:MAG: T9SS type A sorting domain-containing protein, partial [Ignavibacteriota bacterium]